MKEIEIPHFLNQTYKCTCPRCKKPLEYRTRADYGIEHYLPVYVRCDCGHYVPIQVPVR